MEVVALQDSQKLRDTFQLPAVGTPLFVRRNITWELFMLQLFQLGGSNLPLGFHPQATKHQAWDSSHVFPWDI